MITTLTKSNISILNKQPQLKPEPYLKSSYQKNTLRFIPLGGLGEIGKNMSVFEYGDDMIIIDAGMMFPHQEMLGVDYVIQDISFLEKNKHKIRGLILTHGHEDHIGAVPYIWPKLGCPIWATPLTFGLISVKFSEFGISNSKLHKIKPGDILHLGKFTLETFPMSHTFPDEIGLVLRTPLGNFVYLADFKIEHQIGKESQQFLAKLDKLGQQGVMALFLESTNVEEKGHSISERVVEQTIDSIFAKARGRLIVTSFASSISRIQAVANACQKYHRKLAIVGRSMERNAAMAMEAGYLKIPKELIVNPRRIKKFPDDKIAIMCTGSQGEELSALSRIAGGEHRIVHIRPGDTIVISGSVIPGHERAVADVVNNLFRLGGDVVYGGEAAELHASGHAKVEDLKIVIQKVKPKYFVPIHGEYRMLVLHARLAHSLGIDHRNIFVVENGQIIEFSKVGTRVLKEKIPAGYVLVDGLGIGDVGNIVLRDRQAMAKDGILVAIMTVDAKTGKLITSPDIISRGFIYMRESEELVFKIRQEVKRLLAVYNEQHRGDLAMIKAKIRDDIGQFIFNETQRRPMVLPVIIEV